MHLALFLGKKEKGQVAQPTSSIVSNLRHVKIYDRTVGFNLKKGFSDESLTEVGMWNIKSRHLIDVRIAFAASKPAQIVRLHIQTHNRNSKIRNRDVQDTSQQMEQN